MYAFPTCFHAFRTAHVITSITYASKILAFIEAKNPKRHRLQETSLAQTVTEDKTVTKD